MKKIIPFKKDVAFKTNLSEITSISLENTLNLKNDTISGDFIISGEYKVSDKSTTVEPFTLKLPFEIVIDDKYDTRSSTVDIDDFYYEIINNNTLSVSIDVLIDHLSEKSLLEELTPSENEVTILDKEERENDTKEEVDIMEEIEKSEDDTMEKESKVEERCIEEEDEIIKENIEDKKDEVEDKINSIFNNNTFDSDVYVAYNVFIVRDGDTLESIMEKYNVTEEELKKYNDLSNLKLGDKLIIPNNNERD